MQDLEKLVKGAQQNDPEAFEALISEIYPDLIYIALTVAGPEDAQDIAQEAVLQLYKDIQKLRYPSKFRLWLYRVVTNLAKNMKKKQGRLILFDQQEENPAVVQPEDQWDFLPEEFVENEEKRQLLRETIASLKPQQRDVLLLFYYQNCSYEEIAQTLNINHDRVKNLLYRGRTNLKKALEKVLDQDFTIRVLSGGVVPVLSRALHSDAQAMITPEMGDSLLQVFRTAAYGTAVLTGGATGAASAGSSSTAAKIIAISTASVTAAAGITAGVLLSDPPEPAAEPASSAVVETVHSAPPVADSSEAVQETLVIQTLDDMIGTGAAEALEGFIQNGTDTQAMDAFVSEIQAEGRDQASEADYSYRLYELVRQDKQLVLMVKQDNRSGKVSVKYRFGGIEELPRMVRVILDFE